MWKLSRSNISYWKYSVTNVYTINSVGILKTNIKRWIVGQRLGNFLKCQRNRQRKSSKHCEVTSPDIKGKLNHCLLVQEEILLLELTSMSAFSGKNLYFLRGRFLVLKSAINRNIFASKSNRVFNTPVIFTNFA